MSKSADLRLTTIQLRLMLLALALALCLLVIVASYSLVAAYYRVIPEMNRGVSNLVLPEGQTTSVTAPSLRHTTTRVLVLSYISVTGPSLIDPAQAGEHQQVVLTNVDQ